MEDNQLLEKISETIFKIPNRFIYLLQEYIDDQLSIDGYQKINLSQEVENDYFNSGITDLQLIQVLLDKVDKDKKYEPYSKEIIKALYTVLDYVKKIDNRG